MSIFVVTYHYVDDLETIGKIRPTHREWLGGQLKAGNLLASGPLVHRPAALLIWKADSIESLNELLDQDPFEVAGLIDERTIEEWNSVFGPWS